MINRLPEWFKQEITDGATLKILRKVAEFRLVTVCQKAKCPNLNYCFKNSKITFMLLGDVCTRHCRFCAIEKSKGAMPDIDFGQPARIARIAKEIGLNYIVITSVARDDLSDGGAAVFAKAIELIRGTDRNIKVEALIPDFQGNPSSLKTVVDASPSVIAHNIETVKRLYKELRPQADYERSLVVLKNIKEMSPGLITKSSLMLGMGETEGEVILALQDLRSTDCDILTLGQYLAPSREHYPVREFIGIAQFAEFKKIAYSLGFKKVLSAPLVRSSYQAEEAYSELIYA